MEKNSQKVGVYWNYNWIKESRIKENSLCFPESFFWSDENIVFLAQTFRKLEVRNILPGEETINGRKFLIDETYPWQNFNRQGAVFFEEL